MADEVDRLVRQVVIEWARRGGSVSTPKKRRAVRANLEKARRLRWKKKS